MERYARKWWFGCRDGAEHLGADGLDGVGVVVGITVGIIGV